MSDYMTNCTYYADRLHGDRPSFLTAWHAAPHPDESTCANVAGEVSFDATSKKGYFGHVLHGSRVPLYRALPSALLMYRLSCCFEGSIDVNGQGYKCVWAFTLRHAASGKTVTFGDHKGAASFWLPESTYEQLAPGFGIDLLALVNYLVSDLCQHPYDGLLAGSVA